MVNNYDQSPQPMPEVHWANYLGNDRGDFGRKTSYIEKPVAAATGAIYESLIAKRKPKSKKKYSNSR